MGHGNCKSNELAFEENRFDDGDIRRMRVAFERVVADEDIAGADRGAVFAFDGLDLSGECAGKDGYTVGL